MIRASFNIRGESAAFTVKGHSGFADEGEDVICAAVSSAAYLTANTITDVLGVNADIEVEEGFMHLSFSGSSAAGDLVKGLKLHLEQLSAQYPDFVKVTTEV